MCFSDQLIKQSELRKVRQVRSKESQRKVTLNIKTTEKYHKKDGNAKRQEDTGSRPFKPMNTDKCIGQPLLKHKEDVQKFTYHTSIREVPNTIINMLTVLDSTSGVKNWDDLAGELGKNHLKCTFIIIKTLLRGRLLYLKGGGQ